MLTDDEFKQAYAFCQKKNMAISFYKTSNISDEDYNSKIKNITKMALFSDQNFNDIMIRDTRSLSKHIIGVDSISTGRMEDIYRDWVENGFQFTVFVNYADGQRIPTFYANHMCHVEI